MCAWAFEPSAADLAVAIRNAGLESSECYRVRELSVIKEDLRLFLTDGYLIFGKPVNGRRVAAVFTADVQGGAAEVLLLPPHRSERLSLATFTESPNLNEHFRNAVMLFTDGTAEELLQQIRSRGPVREAPEMGALLSDRWAETVRNLSASLDIRLVRDLLSGPSSQGMFYAAIDGRKLGNIDLVYDPEAREQILAGQVRYRDDRSWFDIWTSFQSRSARQRGTPLPPPFTLANFRIEATLDSDLKLQATTAATLTPARNGLQSLLFDISRRMRVGEVFINGEPAEALQRESLRANLIRGTDNELFLVRAPRPLEAGRHYEIVIAHEGNVITEAGRQVYYVGSRGSWYPQANLQFAQYDITFRYPSSLELVFPGEVVEQETEPPWNVTRRRTGSPIRVAGFNLGHYQRAAVTRSGYTVEVCANRQLETALQPRPQQVIVLPQTTPGWPRQPQRRPMEIVTIPVIPLPPNPAARLQALAGEIANDYEFLASHFGPPPFTTLTVSPIPGTFGQGFPGLLYLSTLAYLSPSDRPASVRGEQQQLFFSEILHAHETAHQWWGNVVAAAAYQDEWLMEALANYTALLALEKRRGARAFQSVLDEYRDNLSNRDDEGRTIESAGPIAWGTRLVSSRSPGAWRTITYEKGSWIMHMLRRRLGDDRFLVMLGDLCRKYRFQTITTEQFRKHAAAHLAPKSPDPELEQFFENWVHSTGIPSFQLSHSVRGKGQNLVLTLTLKQSGVSEGFSTLVPVEVQFAGLDSLVRWIRTGPDPAVLTVPVRRAPTRVILNPGHSVLSARR